MSFRPPPITLIALALAVGIAAISTVVMVSHRQPWLGIRFGLSAEKTGIVVIRAEGPSAAVPEGIVVTHISSATDTMELEPLDLTIEPDGTMGDYATYDRFLARQDRLARIQGAPEISLASDDGRIFTVSPASGGRPFFTLPPDFWAQMIVGITAWLVSAAVFVFRPRDAAARYLLLSGAATLLFAPAAAIYTTRELAMNGTLFRWASDLNFFGGSIFTASFIALLFHYPRRIAPPWAGLAAVAVFTGLFVLQHFGAFESMTFARRFFVMVGVGFTFVLAGIHWHLTRRDPVARAALQWFLLSWMLGTSIVAVFILLPQLFGVDTSPVQGYSFLLFLLVYGGLAFGILRYRLFDLGNWWRRVAVWTIAVLLLVLLDVLFLFGLKLSAGTSLALTLAICGVVWLPLRAWIWGRVRRNPPRQGDCFRQAMDVALTPLGEDANARWRSLLASLFDPLDIRSEPGDPPGVIIEHDGLVMVVPPVRSLTAVRLEFARSGRSLFSPHDVTLANDLVSMLAHALESRSAYEKGATEERSRIARDMHDNIGAQLLAALHSPDTQRKDSKIRETLADLRDVINNVSSQAQDLDEILAELRAETSERLAAGGGHLCWENTTSTRLQPPAPFVHSLRSMIREAVSNILRHSGAGQAYISIQSESNVLTIVIADDGQGFDQATIRPGKGILNLRSRVDLLQGSVHFEDNAPGTRLVIRIPITDTRLLK